MEPKQKNKPNALVISLVGLVALMIILYFIFVMFFPTIFDGLNTGELQPVKPE